MVAFFVLPVFAGADLYKSWNEYRTGERFVTTPAQIAMFYPAFELEKREIHTVSRDPLLDDMEPLESWSDTTRVDYILRIRDHLIPVSTESDSFRGFPNH